MALASSFDVYQYLILTYIKVRVYSSTLSSFSSSKPLRSTVSIMSPKAEQLWLGTGCPGPAPALARMPTSLTLESSPSGTGTGCLSLVTNPPQFPPQCNECCSLCLQSQSRITQSQLLRHLKKLERKSELFQFFLCNLFSFPSFRKEGNMQWQV